MRITIHSIQQSLVGDFSRAENSSDVRYESYGQNNSTFFSEKARSIDAVLLNYAYTLTFLRKKCN